MRAHIAKSALGYLAEFHCHTRRSHDGFTSEEELLRSCIAKGIGLLTITEHDRLPQVDRERFARSGVHVIPGCEFTCERGSHIIGLFIDGPLAPGRSAEEIFGHILGQRGLILIPHPFKPGSGFCALYEDHERYLPRAALIEAYNGGVSEPAAWLEQIQALARVHSLKIVAASDAHQASQVGYYVTAYPELIDNDVRTTLLRVQGRLYVDSTRRRAPRALNAVQERTIYQQLVTSLPQTPKRMLKLGIYAVRQRGYRPAAARYTEL